jgi:hypothetical protein
VLLAVLLAVLLPGAVQHGEDIIAALCQASATFDGKTEFAQEKYKKKKARKYNALLTLLQPNSWLICQVRLVNQLGADSSTAPCCLGLLPGAAASSPLLYGAFRGCC